jgi:hypothetical protein
LINKKALEIENLEGILSRNEVMHQYAKVSVGIYKDYYMESLRIELSTL